MSRLLRALRSESGFSLVELLTVMVMLGVVVAGLTTLFVQGSNGELDLNRRFQAQEGARVALDKLRREVHCSSAITPTGASTSVALTLAASCPTSGGSATTANWCALQVPGAPAGQFGLYRQTGASCTTSGTKYADYLTSSSVFNYSAPDASYLGTLRVDLKVNTKPSMGQETFELKDCLVLRNTTRTGSSTTAPTC
ncbi:MAG: PilW family protein [Gaiellaceae bacterium]